MLTVRKDSTALVDSEIGMKLKNEGKRFFFGTGSVSLSSAIRSYTQITNPKQQANAKKFLWSGRCLPNAGGFSSASLSSDGKPCRHRHRNATHNRAPPPPPIEQPRDTFFATRLHDAPTSSTDPAPVSGRGLSRCRYDQHTAAVRAYFANRPDDLLELCLDCDVPEGGEHPDSALRTFLGCAHPPGTQFPHKNAARKGWSHSFFSKEDIEAGVTDWTRWPEPQFLPWTLPEYPDLVAMQVERYRTQSEEETAVA